MTSTQLTKRLRDKREELKSETERTVYDACVNAYVFWRDGLRQNKQVSKTELLQKLCAEGLFRRRPDGRLPDDRLLRKTVAEMQEHGIPILATSRAQGYFVGTEVEEFVSAACETKSRIAALAKKYIALSECRGLMGE